MKELARIALNDENIALRIAAGKEILDRAYGKAPQAMGGLQPAGVTVVNVLTGVPRSELPVGTRIVGPNAGIVALENENER